MADALTLRLMAREEVERFFIWAADEGWEPGVHDADSLWAADPEAFVAAEVSDELVGGCAIPAFGSYGALGGLIVRPEHRSAALVERIWSACLGLLRGRLGGAATIGIDGVSADRERYTRAGFVFSHRLVRYETVGSDGPRAGELVPATDVPFGRLADYDRRCFPASRERLLRSWLDGPDSLALASLDGGAVRGYGVIRRCGLGARVEPLLADDAAVAETLLVSLSSLVPGEPVLIDIPETNAWAMSLAKRHRMFEVSSRGRLYLGPAPRVTESRIFGELTFGLG